MLSVDLAKSIVDKTTSLLGIMVNIMDAKGYVIASGNTDRIGTYHSGAARVIASGKPMTISAEQARSMEGVAPGITLPIIFRDQIIGAVGMTGDPKVVEKYGELVRLTTELMVEQASIKEELYLEQRAKESLLVDLCTGTWNEDKKAFMRRAELLGYDFRGRYLVMAAQLHSKLNSQTAALQFQKIKDNIEGKLSECNLHGRRIITCVANGWLSVLYPLKMCQELIERETLGKIAQRVYEMVTAETDICATLGIGGVSEDWQQIHIYYCKAGSALTLAAKYHPESRIAFFNEYITEFTLEHIPMGTRNDYYMSILNGLLACKKEQCALSLNTMQVYFDNDMNSQKTAEALFVHRNTLNMRLKRIREITGYSPHLFRDAFQLKLATMLLQMDDSVKREKGEE